MARAGFDPASHSGKALVNVLESYPRDELFQIDEDTLFDFAMAIMALEERPRVRVLARRDKFDRFVSVLVFVPRDRYDSDIRKRIGDYLADGLRRPRLGLLSGLPRRSADPRPLHHRPGRGADAESRPGDPRGRGQRDHPQTGSTGWRRRSATKFDPARARGARGALPRCLPGRLSRRRSRRRPPSTTSRPSRRCRPSGRSGQASTARIAARRMRSP